MDRKFPPAWVAVMPRGRFTGLFCRLPLPFSQGCITISSHHFYGDNTELNNTPNFDLSSPKIVTVQEFCSLRESFSQGARVVFTNGCFDILHAGHVDLLSRARSEGDLLVLGLNSDVSVRSIKGEKRPVNSQQHRAFVLAGLSCIDYVIFFDEDTPYNLISAVKPDVLVKGGDWSVCNIVGRDVVEEYGGQVLSLPLLPGYSTTGLIRRIREEGIE